MKVNDIAQIKNCSCGGYALIKNFGDDEKPIYMIQCVDCLKSVLGKNNEDKETIIERWNSMN